MTEWVTGLDLVAWQIRVARGEELGFRTEPPRGHSIEVRVYAEDPAQNFMPSPGRITYLRVPSGPNVRDDSGVYPGYTVPTVYDPMISKLSVWAPTRLEAIARMRRALAEYVVKGITTNIRYLRAILEHPEFVAGQLRHGLPPRACTRPCSGGTTTQLGEVALLAAVVDAYQRDQRRQRTIAPVTARPGGPLALAACGRAGAADEPPKRYETQVRGARGVGARGHRGPRARAGTSSRCEASRTPWTRGCSTTARSRSWSTDARTTSSSTSPATRSRCWSVSSF